MIDFDYNYLLLANCSMLLNLIYSKQSKILKASPIWLFVEKIDNFICDLYRIILGTIKQLLDIEHERFEGAGTYKQITSQG